MRWSWLVVALCGLFSGRAEAGFEAGGTMTIKAPKIELDPRQAGGDPLPGISEIAGDRFLVDQADLLGTFGDFVNPADALAAEALAAGRSTFPVPRADEKKATVAFEVISKAFGVKFKTSAADPDVVVMDDPKDGLPPVELYAGDTVTLFFQLDLVAADGSVVANRFGTEAVVVDTGKGVALEATTVVAALGAPKDGGYAWALVDGRGAVARTPGGVLDVADFASLLALTDGAQREAYLYAFADVYPKGVPVAEYRSDDVVNGPAGTAVSLRQLPPHQQIRVTATIHYWDDWQGEVAGKPAGSGTLGGEALADAREMDGLLAGWAGLGVQTASEPPELVLDSRTEAPYAVPAEGTVVVLGVATSIGRMPGIRFTSTRVDIVPDGRIHYSALVGLGSITVLATRDGWTVVRTTTKDDGSQVYETVTYAEADGAAGAVKAWFGGQGLTGDRLEVSGKALAVRRPRNGVWQRILIADREDIESVNK